MQTIRTLLFTGGSIHDSPAIGEVLQAVLQRDGAFEVTWVQEDLSVFEPAGLADYDLVVLYYEHGALSDAQRNGLLGWVASGKGFVGVHSAAVSFDECPEYFAMLGGRFLRHPPYRAFQVTVVDPEHPLTAGLDEFMAEDEQYLLDWDPRVHVLAAALHRREAMPVAWTKSWGKGRVYYLSLGHDPRACGTEPFVALLVRGARWAATGEA